MSYYGEWKLKAKIRRQAAEITRLLAENKRLKDEYEKMYAEMEDCELNEGRGAEKAWELARKIILPQSQGGMNDEDYKEIFGSGFSEISVMRNYTYSEAAAKVAEWEKAKEKICVGDVVRFKENNSIEFCVTDILDDSFLYGINAKGGLYSDTNIEFVEKTGRHIDIDSFLKQIGGE